MENTRPHKYIIVGFHSSGKREVLEDLQNEGIKTGKLFTTADKIPAAAYCVDTINYTVQDVEMMFENQAYIFVHQKQYGPTIYYEGLSFYEYDNNDVFAMTPSQFNEVPNLDSKKTCIVWMDNNVSDRRQRYSSNHYKYDFAIQEEIDKINCAEFVDKLNEYDVLYFNNEVPERVSAIIKSLILHPDLYDTFLTRYK